MEASAMDRGNSGFQHHALFYGGVDEYLDGTRRFIEDGLASDEPVLVAVPGSKIDITRAALRRADAQRVRFVDMTALGRNPGRIIPMVRAWVDGQRGTHSRFIGEPIWPGRTAPEAAEATRHEALINLAFADADATILCPYDTATLDDEVLLDARATHPELIEGDRHRASDRYTDPVQVWSASRWPLPEPVEPVASTSLNGSLRAVRAFTADRARELGLSGLRTADLVLAVNEAVTNALLHGSEPCRLRIWGDDGRVVCEVSDGGRLEDPLAGRREPAPEWASGRGVWLMNQLCDLVELHGLDSRTTVRLHVDLA
jgi:anti-sigma regulatory factor (Ser/Thr protein kinase)